MAMPELEATLAELEATKPAPSNTSSIRSWTAAIALACAQLISSSTIGDEGPQKTQIVAAKKDGEVREHPLDVALQKIKNDIPLLDHNDYYLRQEAEKRITVNLIDVLQKRNPLPRSFSETISFNPKLQSAEQWKRLERILKNVEEIMTGLPGRIASSEITGRSTIDLLEEQFGMSLIIENEGLKKSLQVDKNGVDGQKSGDVLARLCRDYKCIAELTPKGLVMRPANHGETFAVYNDQIGVIKAFHGETYFRIPDQGLILEADGYMSSPRATVALGTPDFLCYKPQKEASIVDGSLSIVICDKPITRKINATDGAEIEIGPHRIHIDQIRQETHNKWIVAISGSVYEDMEWHLTSSRQDGRTYQLAHAIVFKGSNGVSTSRGVASKLIIDKRTYTRNIEIHGERPKFLEITSFTQIKEDKIDVTKFSPSH